MRPLNHALFTLATVSLLAGCAEVTQPTGSGPLTQGDTTESVTAVSQQLMTALMRATNDKGVMALQELPSVYNGATDPLGEIGSASELPRGVYHYDPSSSSWVLDTPSDDLSLSWLYSDAPDDIPFPEPEPTPTPTPDPLEPTATRAAILVFDWDANSSTRTVRSAYGTGVEVPTGLSVRLTADNETAADLDADLSYYASAACPAGILEPTSITLDGTGSFLTLENVGMGATGEGSDAALATQGKVTLTQDNIYLAWDIRASGEPSRGPDCFTQDISVGPGTFAAELGGFAGDTRSIALRFAFSDPDGGSAPTLSDGALVINSDDSRAVTFEGSTEDDNGNGVPGDALTITFPDGNSTTLEQLLQDWYANNPIGRLLRLR